MKLRYLFATLAAALTIFAGCEPEADHFLEEVQVSSSYLAFPAGGGTVPVTVTAIADWSIKDLPEWISASAKAGAAGESTVNFTATAAEETREASFSIECAGKAQTINVIQETEKVEPKLTSMADVIAAGAGNFRICGTVTKIVNTSYGNWYLTDGTTDANSGLGIYVYGTLDKKGNTWSKDPAKENLNCPGNPDAWEIAVGDKVTVEGPYSFYNGTTPEMVDVTVISIERSLIGIDSIELLGVAEGVGVSQFPKEGGSIKVTLKNKGEGFHVVIPEEAKSWLHIEDFGADYVTLSADANEGGDRKVSVSFTTTAAGVAYSCEQEFTQPGAILEVSIADFLAAEVGDTQYRLTGVIVSNYESDSQGQSFTFRDWSGETLVYRLNDYKASGAGIGDVITVVGKRGAYKDNPQMVSGVYEKHIATVKDKKLAEIAAAADSKEVYYLATGTVKEIADPAWGNAWLTDDSGDLYLYGCYPGWGATGDNRKGLFDAKGIKVGDKLSVIAVKATFKDAAQLSNGIYFSHEEGSGPGPGPEDTFDYTPSAAYLASGNLWKPVEDAKAQRYFYSVNPDWAGQIYSGFGTDLPPYVEFKQSTYKLNLETATSGRWQNQFFVHPNDGSEIPLDPAKSYKFSVTVQSTTAFNAFFKVVAADASKDNREGGTIWEPAGDADPSNIFFEAGKPIVLENVIEGVEAPSINVFFDLGGNPAGTVVYIKDITLVEVGGGTPSVTDFIALEDGTQSKLSGTVAALGKNGIIVTDGTTNLYVFKPATTPAIGDNVIVEGTKTTYFGLIEVAQGASVTVESSGNAVPITAVKDITANFDTYPDSAPTSDLIKFEGTVAVSGSYTNIIVDGASARQGSPQGLDVSGYDGKKLTLTGYYIGTSGTGGKYINIIVTEFKESGASVEANITIDGDMSDWASVPGEETPDNICKVMKVHNDADNFYVYLESEPGPRGSALWGDASGYYYIDFDWDNNDATGIAENSNPGFDCWFYMYVFGGTADAPYIKEHPNGDGKEMKIDNITAKGVITSELIQIELSIPRADMVAVEAGTVTRILSWRSKDGTKIQMNYTVK